MHSSAYARAIRTRSYFMLFFFSSVVLLFCSVHVRSTIFPLCTLHRAHIITYYLCVRSLYMLVSEHALAVAVLYAERSAQAAISTSRSGNKHMISPHTTRSFSACAANYCSFAFLVTFLFYFAGFVARTSACRTRVRDGEKVQIRLNSHFENGNMRAIFSFDLVCECVVCDCVSSHLKA